jgi:DNA polymerase-1
MLWLELRMLASFMNDEEYTNEILNGDIHTTNQAMQACLHELRQRHLYTPSSTEQETLRSVLLWVEVRELERKLRQRFLDNTPALAELRERVSIAAQRGYLRGLDGRCLHIRSEHSALNTLLQSAGAVVMKKALQIFTEYAPKWNLTYKLLGLSTTSTR